MLDLAEKHLSVIRHSVICYISESASHNKYSVKIRNRTIPDFIKAFPDYSKQDSIRLWAMTGGILGIAKELDETASCEENLIKLLQYDSAFSNYLPQRLNEYFRTPKSYYPILKSLASGNSRLSDIAREVGFPNNKCLKYLEALIKLDFVKAEKKANSSHSTYHLENSYFAAWCKYCNSTFTIFVSFSHTQ